MKTFCLLIMVFLLVLIFSGCITSNVEDPVCDVDMDVNQDGIVDYRDAGLIHNYRTDLGCPYMEKYDMNCDGIVDQIDVDICWNS